MSYLNNNLIFFDTSTFRFFLVGCTASSDSAESTSFALRLRALGALNALHVVTRIVAAARHRTLRRLDPRTVLPFAHRQHARQTVRVKRAARAGAAAYVRLRTDQHRVVAAEVARARDVVLGHERQHFLARVTA